jgi:cell wall-associated NlpC family hydrolase
MNSRDWQAFKAIRLARHFIGIPYKWNGKTPQGFDCSGLVCEILQSVGILRHGTVLSSRGLSKRFAGQTVDSPYRGCLVFYGRPRVSHVAICVDDTYMIEAGGGGSTTKTILDSVRKRAYVRQRRIDRRDDIVGYADPFMEAA